MIIQSLIMFNKLIVWQPKNSYIFYKCHVLCDRMSFFLLFSFLVLFIETQNTAVWLIMKEGRANTSALKFVLLSAECKYDSTTISTVIWCCPHVCISKSVVVKFVPRTGSVPLWQAGATMEKLCHRCFFTVGRRGLARHRLSHNNSTRLPCCSIACLSGSSPQKQNTTAPLNQREKQSIVFTQAVAVIRRWKMLIKRRTRPWWSAPAASRAATLFL